MKKEEKLILIQSFLKPTICIILQNNNIVNIFFDTEEEEVGNIYKGRITNITPGINACFVSLGNSQSGFLNFNDIPENFKIR
jgi:Ribonucleases G and E